MELTPEQRLASAALAQRMLGGNESEIDILQAEGGMGDNLARSAGAAVLTVAVFGGTAVTANTHASASSVAASQYELPGQTNATDPFTIESGDQPLPGITITIPAVETQTATKQPSVATEKARAEPQGQKLAVDTSKDLKPRRATIKGERVPDSVYGNAYLSQHDKRWAKRSYNPLGIHDRIISGSGCGPTSLAIILTEAGEKVTPYQVGQNIIRQGLRAKRGTAHKALVKIPEDYGIDAGFIPSTSQAIDRAFRVGKAAGEKTFVIVNGLDEDPETPATTGGHIYVVAGIAPNGEYRVLDPNSYAKTLNTFPKWQVSGPATMAVRITIPAKEKPAEDTITTIDKKTAPEAVEPAGQFDNVSAVDSAIEINAASLPSVTIPDIIVTPPIASPVKKSKPTPSAPPPAEKTSKGAEYKITARDEAALEAMINLGDNWKNRGIALRYLMREGLNPAQAAGPVGNFMIESNDHTGDDVNPRAKQLNDGPGRGLAQWTAKTANHAGGRWDTDPVNLLDFASDRGLDPYALETQLAFIVYEGRDSKTQWNDTWPALLATNNPGDAAIAFEKNYEAAGAPAHGPRSDAAQKVYDKFNELLAG